MVSSVKSLLSGCVTMKTWLEGVATGGGGHTSGAGVGCLGFVDLTFWRCWARWPIIVSSESGQYLAALEYVRPLKVSQLPAAPMLGRSRLRGSKGVPAARDAKATAWAAP